MMIPCGRCIGCRLEKSRQWAVRLMHEKQMHEEAIFLTITYDDEHLPPNNSLNLRHYQLFNKKLRKYLSIQNIKIRFYHCGEYGETTRRPHYHTILFGYRPTDGILYSEKNGKKLYTSETLSKIWGMGEVWFGEVTFESCAYVARYVTKKITGPMASQHYTYIDPETGEISQQIPEYATMSRRPGIGMTWLEKFGEHTFAHDLVVVNGKPAKPPAAYVRKLKEKDPKRHQKLVGKRLRKSKARQKKDEAEPHYNLKQRQHASDVITQARLAPRLLK